MTISTTRGDLVAEGKGYQARAIEIALDEYESNGQTKQLVKALFEIDGGKYDGRIVEWAGFFTEKATPITVRSLVAMGLDHDDLSRMKISDVRRLVSIEVEHQKIEKGDKAGYLKDRVKWVNSPGGLFVSGMDDGAKVAFAASMRGEIAAARMERGPLREEAAPAVDRSQPADGVPPAQGSFYEGSTRGSGPTDERNPPPADDDDIPF